MSPRGSLIVIECGPSYQLDLTIPGICPEEASSRSAMRDIRALFAGLDDLRAELTVLGRYLLTVVDEEIELLQIAARTPAGRSARLDTAYAALVTRTELKPGETMLDDGRDSGEAERRKRHGDQSQQGHLHFRRPGLLANIFRGAADHKSGEKAGDNAKKQHAEQAGAGRAAREAS